MGWTAPTRSQRSTSGFRGPSSAARQATAREVQEGEVERRAEALTWSRGRLRQLDLELGQSQSGLSL